MRITKTVNKSKGKKGVVFSYKNPVSKYRAIRTEVDGIKFDSKREAKRYGVLRIMERAGLISGLECQVKYPITVNGKLICTYICDFKYLEKGSVIIEDVKGVRTPIYKLKKKLMEAVHGIIIKEV